MNKLFHAAETEIWSESKTSARVATKAMTTRWDAVYSVLGGLVLFYLRLHHFQHEGHYSLNFFAAQKVRNRTPGQNARCTQCEYSP
jgi:hypothetical protein